MFGVCLSPSFFSFATYWLPPPPPPQAVLDSANPAVAGFLSRLPEKTEGASANASPVADQVALLEETDEGFVVPTQVSFAVGFCCVAQGWMDTWIDGWMGGWIDGIMDR